MSLKIKTLSFNSNYKIYSDGRLWNLSRSRFLPGHKHSRLKPNWIVYQIFNQKTNKLERIAKHRLVLFEFENHGCHHHSQLNIIQSKKKYNKNIL
jgi:hypothetical protein